MPQRYDWTVETIMASELKKALTNLDAGGFEIINVFPFRMLSLTAPETEVLIIARRPKAQP